MAGTRAFAATPLFLLAACHALSGGSGAGEGDDLSRPLAFADVAACQFGPAAESAFDHLLIVGDGLPPNAHAPTRLKLEGVAWPVEFTRQPVPTYEGGVDFTASARPPRVSRWNGLELRGLSSHAVILPEVDGSEERALHFAATADQLRAVMQRLGVAFPEGSTYPLKSETGYAAGTCMAEMEIRSEAAGAALVCSRGC